MFAGFMSLTVSLCGGGVKGGGGGVSVGGGVSAQKFTVSVHLR